MDNHADGLSNSTTTNYQDRNPQGIFYDTNNDPEYLDNDNAKNAAAKLICAGMKDQIDESKMEEAEQYEAEGIKNVSMQDQQQSAKTNHAMKGSSHTAPHTKSTPPSVPTTAATPPNPAFDITAIATAMEKLKSHMDDRTRQMEEAAKKQPEADMATFEALRAGISKKITSSPPVHNVKIPASTDDESTTKTYASITCPGSDSPTRSKASASKSSVDPSSKASPPPPPKKHQQQSHPPASNSRESTELVCTTKYKKLNPEDFDYNIKPKQGLFPLGDFSEDMPDHDRCLLWIKVFTKTKDIISDNVMTMTPLHSLSRLLANCLSKPQH
jgi:hypothetical protein